MTTSKPEQPLDTNYGEYWSGKKPYLVHDYAQMMKKKTQEEYFFHELSSMPMSELYKPYFIDDDIVPGNLSWEYMAPPFTWPQMEPPYPPVGYGGCQLACNPASLDCQGGCNNIACICADGGLNASVVSDPTGGLITAFAVNDTMIQVCLNGDPPDMGEYPTAVIRATDGSGATYDVEVQLIDCDECCEEFDVSGDDNVNPDSTWTGSIAPACPDATATATGAPGTSGCNWDAVVSEDGTEVSVAVGADDSGTIMVTVTNHAGKSCNYSDVFYVKINNTGQGGAYGHYGPDVDYCYTCEGMYYPTSMASCAAQDCEDGWHKYTTYGATPCLCACSVDGGDGIECWCSGGTVPDCGQSCGSPDPAPCTPCEDLCTPGEFCFEFMGVDWWQTGECWMQWETWYWSGSCS